MAQYAGPILDNHFHVQRTGRFDAAVADFMAAGGTHATLIPVPGHLPKRRTADWVAFFEDHLGMVDEVVRRTGIGAIPAVGPYPVEFHRTAQAEGLDAAENAFRAGYDAAAQLIQAGRAMAMGEIGRIHYAPVDDEVQQRLNELLVYGMSLARERGVPVILHTEHATAETMADLSRLADRAGLPRNRVIKHYCGPLVTESETAGLVPSIIASKSNVAAAIAKGDRFLMETDYIDDLARPNVVLPPHQVPKRTKALAAQGVPEQSLFRIHKELPERLYGVSIDASGGTS